MGKGSNNKYLVFGLVAALVCYIIVLIITPREIDWSYSFSKTDEVPFGNSILFEELEQLFPKDRIQTSHSPIWNFLKDRDLNGAGILYINNRFEPDELDLEKMLDVVKSGNHIFIAAARFSSALQDTLGFKMDVGFPFGMTTGDSLRLNLVNPKLKSPWGYYYKKAYNSEYFQSYDTLKTTVLGLGDKARTNFIRIQYGAGSFYINTNPKAFTNYNMLIRNNYEYVFKCLSYLPQGVLIWDEYYKYKQEAPVSGSEFRYILSQKSLRYAWYILFFGIIIYMVFAAKRQQRMIPIVKPPENTTLTFVETIGRLYFRKKDHLDIAKKRYRYFLEFLRTQYYVDTAHLNAEIYDEIATKCTVPLRTVQQLFDMGKRLDQVESISEEDLEQFNKKIEFFYDKCRDTKKIK